MSTVYATGTFTATVTGADTLTSILGLASAMQAVITLDAALDPADSVVFEIRSSVDFGINDPAIWRSPVIDSTWDPAVAIVSPPSEVFNAGVDQLIAIETIGGPGFSIKWAVIDVASFTTTNYNFGTNLTVTGTQTVYDPSSAPGVLAVVLDVTNASINVADSTTFQWVTSIDGTAPFVVWDSGLIDSTYDPKLAIVSPPIPQFANAQSKLIAVSTIGGPGINLLGAIVNVTTLT